MFSLRGVLNYGWYGLLIANANHIQIQIDTTNNSKLMQNWICKISNNIKEIGLERVQKLVSSFSWGTNSHMNMKIKYEFATCKCIFNNS